MGGNWLPVDAILTYWQCAEHMHKAAWANRQAERDSICLFYPFLPLSASTLYFHVTIVTKEPEIPFLFFLGSPQQSSSTDKRTNSGKSALSFIIYAVIWILNAPKGLCYEGLVSIQWYFWEVGTFKRWPSGRKLSHCVGGCSWNGLWGFTSFLFLFLLPGWHEMSRVLSHACPPCILCCHKPKSNKANWPWTETSKTGSK
jgi:hypothetical protein